MTFVATGEYERYEGRAWSVGPGPGACCGRVAMRVDRTGSLRPAQVVLTGSARAPEKGFVRERCLTDSVACHHRDRRRRRRRRRDGVRKTERGRRERQCSSHVPGSKQARFTDGGPLNLWQDKIRRGDTTLRPSKKLTSCHRNLERESGLQRSAG